MELISLPLVLLLILNSHSGQTEDETPTLTVQPQTPVFIGDSVTLICELHQPTEYEFIFITPSNNESTEATGNKTIRSVQVSDGGEYKCIARKTEKPQVYTQYSQPITVTVKDIPQPTLTVVPQTSVFIGDSVTLICEVHQSTGWEFVFTRPPYTKDPEYYEPTGAKTITSVRVSDRGDYKCRARRRENHQVYTQYSEPITVTVNDITPTLTVQPQTSVFIGDSITLTCEIGQSTGWEFVFTRSPYTEHPEDYEPTGAKTKTISAVQVSNGGEYWCRAKRRGNPQVYTQYSKPITVRVQDITPTLTVEPKTDVFIGDKVTLICEIHPSTGWDFLFTTPSKTESIETTGTTTIRSVQVSDGGEYKCRARKREDVNVLTQYSQPITVTVQDITPTLTVEPQTSVFIGDSVTLTCKIDQPTGWEFVFTRSPYTAYTEYFEPAGAKTKTITAVQVSDGGRYKCRARRNENHQIYTQYSEPITVRVQERPTPQVSVLPADHVFIGETVTLTCVISRGGVSSWQYSWNKDLQSFTVNYLQNSITFNSVTEPHTGKYTCKGTEISGSRSSHISNAVTLTVSALPRVAVRVTPDSPAFTGETFTLKCEIEDHYRSLDWRYQWRKDTTEVFTSWRYTVNRDSLTINGVTESDQGRFSCSAEIHGRPQTSISSSDVDLTVKALPRATVKVPYNPVFIGETVTLTCEIEDQYRSLNWTYLWYKGTTWPSVYESKIYTIISPSDQDKFRCIGVRDGRPSYSRYSDYVTLSVKALPKATVRVTPDRSVLIGETVTLKCEIEEQYRSLNWTYQWNKNTTAVLNFENYTVNRDSLTITGVTESDKDEFSCRAEINGRPKTSLSSSEFHLAVKERPTPELSVWPPGHLYGGETVNLTCGINRGGVSSWQYSWNKDDSDIQHYEPYYIIISFNESHAGKYTCNGKETRGSRYTHISNAVTLTVSGSSGLIVGVVVGLSVLFLIIFLVLLWWYKNKKGKVFQSPSAVSPQQNISQTSDQKQTEDGYTPLQSGDANIYDSVDATDNKDASSVTQAGPSDAMYSQVNFKKNKLNGKDNESESADLTYADIELKPKKKMKKKKEKKGSTSEGGDTVYSKVKIGDKDGASGSVDVTYAQIK